MRAFFVPDNAKAATSVPLAVPPTAKLEKKLPEGLDTAFVDLCEGTSDPTSVLASAQAKACSSAYTPLSGPERAALGRRPLGASRGRGKGDGKDTAKLFSNTFPPNFSRRMIRDNRVFFSSQMVSWGIFTSSSSAIATFQAAPTIGSLDQVSAYLSLFDQYRVTALEVWVIPRITTVTSATANSGQVATVIDYDDSTALGSFNSALDYENVLVGSGVDGHYRKWVPHVAVTTAGSGVENARMVWLDAASTGVAHYGIKMVWTQTDVAYESDIFVRYHLEWRNVR
jgi:hypothetical protein